MDNVALFKYNASGALLLWTIRAEANKLIIMHGQVNGKMQTVEEEVEINKSGRDLLAQVTLRLKSRVAKQVDKGYCYSIEEAELSKGLNAAKLKRPMLAKKFRDVRNVDLDNAWLQNKYNGHRCIITNVDGEKLAYSRNGKPILSIGHILDGLDIPEDMFFDGELYHHGTSLQTIGSWIKRSQDDSNKLKFIAYDVMLDVPYSTRLDVLHKLIRGKFADVAPTIEVNRHTNLTELLDEAISNGYEGAMLRQEKFGYDAGNRSSSLLKLKKFMDQEFLVLDVTPSKDGWGILTCLLPGDKTFRVSAPGTIENKTEILQNKQNYIGRHITVEFFEWTTDGVPFHPVATTWRT